MRTGSMYEMNWMRPLTVVKKLQFHMALVNSSKVMHPNEGACETIPLSVLLLVFVPWYPS